MNKKYKGVKPKTEKAGTRTFEEILEVLKIVEKKLSKVKREDLPPQFQY